MPRVVPRSFSSENAGKTRAGRAQPQPRTRRIVEDGKVRTVTEVNLDSETAGYDLLTAFRRAVRRARDENKRLLGSADG